MSWINLNAPMLLWLGAFLLSVNTNWIKELFIQREFKGLRASWEFDANRYSQLWAPASLYRLHPCSRPGLRSVLCLVLEKNDIHGCINTAIAWKRKSSALC